MDPPPDRRRDHRLGRAPLTEPKNEGSEYCEPVSKRRDIEHAAEEIEQLFADLWQVFPFSGLRRGFRPQIDCFRTENPPSLTVVVDLEHTAKNLLIRAVKSGKTGNGKRYDEFKQRLGIEPYLERALREET